MPGIGELDALTKSYGFSVGLLIFAAAALCMVIVWLYRENKRLQDKLLELLDARVKFLDSILTEAINEKTHKGSS